MVKKKIKVSDILGDNYYVYKLTSSNYTPALNGSITITCTMKDVYGTAASGKSIMLYQNGTSKGSQTTNSSGVATWSITCSTAGLQIFSIKDTSIEVFVDNKEDKSNKVTSLSSSNTDTQYPSAKAVYDAIFSLDTLDCINENFTLLSLPQIIFTHDARLMKGSTVHILEGYDKGAYVDWGDGTPIETYESTDTLEHSYSDSVQEHIVTIYGDILNLYNNSFENFIRMTSINIPSGVTSLGDYCFNGCTGLTSVVIPSSVTSLGNNCFSGCTNLVDYQLYWETPPVNWSSPRMPNNTDTYFTIPNGTTANYTAKGFPSDKLVERSE